MVNREVLIEGLATKINDQYKQIIKHIENDAEEQLKFDEIVIKIKDLQQSNPELKDVLEIALIEYKDRIKCNATKHLKSWLTWEERAIIKSQLELYTDQYLQSHTLEELASILRP